MTMMAKVETAVNPDAVVGQWNLFLWIDWPLTGSWDCLQLALGGITGTLGELLTESLMALCGPSY